MAELPFPASRSTFEAFLERIRFSPSVVVDRDWLLEYLGISQRPNAGQTLKWLKRIGVLGADGRLSELGRELLTLPRGPRYRKAAAACLVAAATQERLTKLRSGRLTRTALQQALCKEYGVKGQTASKAIVGMHALAEAASDLAVVRALDTKASPPPRDDAPRRGSKSAKAAILKKFSLFAGSAGGIDAWLGEHSPEATFRRLDRLGVEPLTLAQLNQLLALAHSAPLSEGFFRYYWLSCPRHPWGLEALPNYRPEWKGSLAVFELDQLHWGLHRFYIDALLYFGDVRAAYQRLRGLTEGELQSFFGARMFDSTKLTARGPGLALEEIDQGDRYLISELASRALGASKGAVGLDQALEEGLREHKKRRATPTTPGELLEQTNGRIARRYPDLQEAFRFAADEILETPISSLRALDQLLKPLKERFVAAREAALANTELYLAGVGEMDVYVTTSMPTRRHFDDVARFCENVFRHRKLEKYHLRSFDPTMSAAANHQDQGLIGCLLVKCARVLVYASRDEGASGKDAEAAMALSLGKPVIVFCDAERRRRFHQDVHPLSRLVDVQTGVAVGAMVTDDEEVVVTLVDRILTNSMRYELVPRDDGYFLLKEELTDSVVRLQTSDPLLRETFWNHYGERKILGGVHRPASRGCGVRSVMSTPGSPMGGV